MYLTEINRINTDIIQCMRYPYRVSFHEKNYICTFCVCVHVWPSKCYNIHVEVRYRDWLKCPGLLTRAIPHWPISHTGLRQCMKINTSIKYARHAGTADMFATMTGAQILWTQCLLSLFLSFIFSFPPPSSLIWFRLSMLFKNMECFINSHVFHEQGSY